MIVSINDFGFVLMFIGCMFVAGELFSPRYNPILMLVRFIMDRWDVLTDIQRIRLIMGVIVIFFGLIAIGFS